MKSLVVIVACMLLLGAGGVALSVARRVFRLAGLLAVGAALILATNWWMHSTIVGK
ncbi:MAG TPA: hypothetical protein VNT75_26675 [Symbiobacteriaceae bacterium]|nr:hypothetical protein [Symbiobacteriaceae bacterium]